MKETSRCLYSSKFEKDIPEQVEQPKGPTQDALPDVSQEAAAIDKIMHGKKCDGSAPGSPELEQGTPIEEVSLLYPRKPKALTKWCSLKDYEKRRRRPQIRTQGY